MQRALSHSTTHGTKPMSLLISVTQQREHSLCLSPCHSLFSFQSRTRYLLTEIALLSSHFQRDSILRGKHVKMVPVTTCQNHFLLLANLCERPFFILVSDISPLHYHVSKWLWALTERASQLPDRLPAD